MFVCPGCVLRLCPGSGAGLCGTRLKPVHVRGLEGGGSCTGRHAVLQHNDGVMGQVCSHARAALLHGIGCDWD